jgi:hypothetical protein
MTSRPRIARWLVWVAGAAALAVTYSRLYVGVDLLDESYYVAVPFRLVLGARPFVDETSVTQQTAGLLEYPMVLAYHAVAGRTGLVLFVRHVQFLLSLAVGAAVVRALRPAIRPEHAIIVALGVVLFVPFDIHSLSYNTLGGSLLAAALLLGCRAAADGGDVRGLAAAAACTAAAVFAYLPLVVAAAAAGGAWILLARRGRRRVALAVAAGLAAPAVAFAAVVAQAGVGRVADDYRDSSRFLGQGGGVAKLKLVLSHEWTTFRFWYLVVAALALALIVRRRVPVVAVLVPVALPLLAWPPAGSGYTGSLEYVAHYGLLALPLYPAVRAKPFAKPLLLGVWLPSLVAAVTIGYSSGNGGVNFGVGLLAGAIVTTVFLVWIVEATTASAVAAALPAAAVAAALLVLGGATYRDGPGASLTARVRSGPYAGLLTTPRRRAVLEELARDVGGAGERCGIVFFDDLPAGYLLSAARPATNAAWIATVAPTEAAAYRRPLLEYYARRTLPDVAVVMTRAVEPAAGAPTAEYYPADDPLVALVHSRRYTRVAKRPDYTVYRLRSSRSCSPATRAN